MVRPFNLRDLALVHRLSEQGVSLHTKLALTKNLHPMRGALFSLLGGDFPTYVWKAEDKQVAGFIQLYLEEETQHGHIHYLSSTAVPESEASALAGDPQNGDAPSELDNGRYANEAAWLPLLDQAVIESGRRGVHSLVAEVSETGPELPLLRRAGFAVYTRQDVWVRYDNHAGRQTQTLSPRNVSDEWEIQLLYANTVPRLVQLVEPMPPPYDGEGWVLREDNEVTAFVHIHDGSAATWMRLFIHPNAEAQVDDIIASVLQVKSPTRNHPIYCCVRRYQSWIQHALARNSFTLWGSQAVMVKHTVHYLSKSVPELAASLDAQRVTPTAPMAHRYRSTSAANGQARHKNA